MSFPMTFTHHSNPTGVLGEGFWFEANWLQWGTKGTYSKILWDNTFHDLFHRWLLIPDFHALQSDFKTSCHLGTVHSLHRKEILKIFLGRKECELTSSRVKPLGEYEILSSWARAEGEVNSFIAVALKMFFFSSNYHEIAVHISLVSQAE